MGVFRRRRERPGFALFVIPASLPLVARLLVLTMLSMISPNSRARFARLDVLVNVSFTPFALRVVIWRSSLTEVRMLSAAARWLRLALATRNASFEMFETPIVISCAVRACSRSEEHTSELQSQS